MIVLPGKADGPSKVLNSWCNFIKMAFKKKTNLLGISQKLGAKIKKNRVALSQFVE
jgi:hypothetical protein